MEEGEPSRINAIPLRGKITRRLVGGLALAALFVMALIYRAGLGSFGLPVTVALLIGYSYVLASAFGHLGVHQRLVKDTKIQRPPWVETDEDWERYQRLLDDLGQGADDPFAFVRKAVEPESEQRARLDAYLRSHETDDEVSWSTIPELGLVVLLCPGAAIVVAIPPRISRAVAATLLYALSYLRPPGYTLTIALFPPELNLAARAVLEPACYWVEAGEIEIHNLTRLIEN